MIAAAVTGTAGPDGKRFMNSSCIIVTTFLIIESMSCNSTALVRFWPTLCLSLALMVCKKKKDKCRASSNFWYFFQTVINTKRNQTSLTKISYPSVFLAFGAFAETTTLASGSSVLLLSTGLVRELLLSCFRIDLFLASASSLLSMKLTFFLLALMFCCCLAASTGWYLRSMNWTLNFSLWRVANSSESI